MKTKIFFIILNIITFSIVCFALYDAIETFQQYQSYRKRQDSMSIPVNIEVFKKINFRYQDGAKGIAIVRGNFKIKGKSFENLLQSRIDRTIWEYSLTITSNRKLNSSEVLNYFKQYFDLDDIVLSYQVNELQLYAQYDNFKIK